MYSTGRVRDENFWDPDPGCCFGCLTCIQISRDCPFKFRKNFDFSGYVLSPELGMNCLIHDPHIIIADGILIFRDKLFFYFVLIQWLINYRYCSCYNSNNQTKPVPVIGKYLLSGLGMHRFFRISGRSDIRPILKPINDIRADIRCRLNFKLNIMCLLNYLINNEIGCIDGFLFPYLAFVLHHSKEDIFGNFSM
jgi:hypothetical protein